MKSCYCHCSAHRTNAGKPIRICQLGCCNNSLLHPEYTNCIMMPIYRWWSASWVITINSAERSSHLLLLLCSFMILIEQTLCTINASSLNWHTWAITNPRFPVLIATWLCESNSVTYESIMDLNARAQRKIVFLSESLAEWTFFTL